MIKDQTYLDIESGKYPPIENNEREALARHCEQAAECARNGDYIGVITFGQTIEQLGKGMFRTYPQPLKNPFKQ